MEGVGRAYTCVCRSHTSLVGAWLRYHERHIIIIASRILPSSLIHIRSENKVLDLSMAEVAALSSTLSGSSGSCGGQGQDGKGDEKVTRKNLGFGASLKVVLMSVSMVHPSKNTHSAEYALTATTVRITARPPGHTPSLKQCTRSGIGVHSVPKIVLSTFRGGAFAPPPLSLGVFSECYAAVANTNVQRKMISVFGAHLKGFLGVRINVTSEQK